MPNWCHNTLTVTGEQKPLEAFVEAARLQREQTELGYAETLFLGDKPEISEYVDRASPSSRCRSRASRPSRTTTGTSGASSTGERSGTRTSPGW